MLLLQEKAIIAIFKQTQKVNGLSRMRLAKFLFILFICQDKEKNVINMGLYISYPIINKPGRFVHFFSRLFLTLFNNKLTLLGYIIFKQNCYEFGNFTSLIVGGESR
jgi:hypothetical protein